MTRRVIGLEPLVLPARGFRAGMGLHGSAPHSRGAKRRENVEVTGAARLYRTASVLTAGLGVADVEMNAS